MLSTILQTNISTDEEFQLLQQQAFDITNTSLNQINFSDSNIIMTTKIIFFIEIILLIIMVIAFIIGLINVYHWGMTDKAIFEVAKENKKKWFYILVLLPVICIIIGIIPLIGQLISFFIFLFWLVMSIQYFFLLRKKLK